MDEAAAAFGMELHDDDDGGEQKSFVVWVENRPAFELFARCHSQWRYAGESGRRVGLDYQGVRIVAEIVGAEMSLDMFDDIQRMESAALTAWAEELERVLASQGQNHG